MNKIKSFISFIKDVFDFNKIKLIILIELLFVLSILVGCRYQMYQDDQKYQIQIAAMTEFYDARISELMAQSENGLYVSNRFSNEYDNDAYLIAQWLGCLDERYILSTESKEMACWVIFNRVDNENYPNSVREVLTQKAQFDEFSEEEIPIESNMAIAKNQIARWKSNDIRPVPTRAVYVKITNNEVVLRDTWEENYKTGHWSA